MIAIYIFLAILGGCTLFLAGFYTGIWIQRHSREIIEREVPKVVQTEKVVVHDRPVVVQLPAPKQAQGPSAPVYGARPATSVITDPAKREEAERMTSLMNQLPEA